MSATGPIQTWIDSAKAQLATLTTKLAALTTQVAGLATRLTKAESMIITMQQKLASGTVLPPAPVSSPPATQPPYIYIVSSALASLPAPGNRVGPSDAANMFKIVAAGSPLSAITTSNNAHHYRFIGAEITPPSSGFSTNLIAIGSGETSLSTLPNNIVFDRCYIHGDPTLGGRRGIALNGASCAVIDSYVSDFKEVGADNQAIWAYNSPGPLKIVNNYLEAACENMMFGGADPSITNLVPSDLEIRRNYFFKPLAWIAQSWSVKNILEFKNAQRILVEGNVFQNIWVSGQTGFALNAKSVNQDGTGTWCIVQDLTYRKNRAINCENGLSFSGDTSEGSTALAPTRWSFSDNEVQVANVNGGTGYGVFLGQGTSPRYLTHLDFKHNTLVGIRATQFHTEWGTVNGICVTDESVMDNLFEGGTNGFDGRDSPEGTQTLDDRATNGTIRYNAWQGRSSANYGAASGSGNTMSNNFFPATQAAIGFTNYAGGDYSLSGSSSLHNAASDGSDVGADIAALNAACLRTINGQWGSEPATYSTGAGVLAEIPRTFLNTTYTPQSGATILVHSAGDLQAAINSASLGDTIVVDAGATFTLKLNLPAK